MKSLLKAGLSFFFLIAISPMNAYSEAPKEEKKEAPAEESGTTKSSSTQEILDLQARLQILKTKISAKKENIKKLIDEKQATRDEKQAVHIVNIMKAEYKELQAAVKEYTEQRSLLNYRYPEKGRAESRVYERIEIKSLDEMEGEYSIEGKVKRAVGRVRQHYPNVPNQAKTKKEEANVNATPSPQVHDTSRSSVTESQILSK